MNDSSWFLRNSSAAAAATKHAMYHVPRRQLVEGLPDPVLTLAAPIVAYWTLSLFFHLLDVSGWKALDAYRIHESEEAKRRNLVSKANVVWVVVFQQVLQTALGMLVLKEEDADGGGGGGDGWGDLAVVVVVDRHEVGVRRIATTCVGPAVAFLFGELEGRRRPSSPLIDWISDFAYWWAVPALQFLAAIFIIDTWQYFLHRWMHTNKFLYRHCHSWHHRLYVPYAFGSLYNHPVEGFLLDTLGAVVAETATGMNARQAMVLFAVSSLKTVDDHCGYRLPWDPIQRLTRNNADYHDIHHQVVGIKSNFSQPFFVHWDTILGTRMTRDEFVRLRAQRRKEKTM